MDETLFWYVALHSVSAWHSLEYDLGCFWFLTFRHVCEDKRQDGMRRVRGIAERVITLVSTRTAM